MSAFVLKLIAMSAMVADHAGSVFFDNSPIMRSIGRLAFLTYAFLVAEAYYHLKDKPERLRVHVVKYLVLALVSEVPFDLFESGVWLEFGTQNAVFTLLLGFLTLIVCDRWIKKLREHKALAFVGCVVIVCATAVIACLCRFEFKAAGVVFIVLSYCYLSRADRWSLPKRAAALAGICAVFLVLQLWYASSFGGWTDMITAAQEHLYWVTGLPLVILPLALYNRKPGYRSRWFDIVYSSFYPLQFAAFLVLLRVIGS